MGQSSFGPANLWQTYALGDENNGKCTVRELSVVYVSMRSWQRTIKRGIWENTGEDNGSARIHDRLSRLAVVSVCMRHGVMVSIPQLTLRNTARLANPRFRSSRTHTRTHHIRESNPTSDGTPIVIRRSEAIRDDLGRCEQFVHAIGGVGVVVPLLPRCVAWIVPNDDQS